MIEFDRVHRIVHRKEKAMRTIEVSWSVDKGTLVCRWDVSPERADGSSRSNPFDRFGMSGEPSRQPSAARSTESSESNWRAVFGFGRAEA
jgi:hypothetical protein